MYLDPATGLLDAARYVCSPNCDARPAGATVDALVIHAISLPPGQYSGNYVEDFFCNRLDPGLHEYFAEVQEMMVSAHFYIRRDGTLLQFVPTLQRAWHAGKSALGGREKVNDFSIGIELEGSDDGPFSDAQYEVLIELSNCLIRSYPELSAERIVGHCDIAPGRKTDPGPYFDWQRFRNALYA